MREAYAQALLAFEQDEIPIGAIVVYEGNIIGRGYNKRQQSNQPFAHAEIKAMNQAAVYLNSWNLSGCTLYVTVEPCPMCSGALIQSQCSRVVYGVTEPNSGSLGSVIDLSKQNYNHKLEVSSGVMAQESKDLMQTFFRKLRKDKVKVKKVTAQEFDEYLQVRKDVFVKEQQVPLEMEIDELDVFNHEDVVHIGAYIEGKIVGTCRLIKDGKDLRVGRVAVLKQYRKKGVGDAMMRYAEKQALNNGYERLKLGAQLTAIPFYENCGYSVEGDIYLDAFIEHKDMIRILKRK